MDWSRSGHIWPSFHNHYLLCVCFGMMIWLVRLWWWLPMTKVFSLIIHKQPWWKPWALVVMCMLHTCWSSCTALSCCGCFGRCSCWTVLWDAGYHFILICIAAIQASSCTGSHSSSTCPAASCPRGPCTPPLASWNHQNLMPLKWIDVI